MTAGATTLDMVPCPPMSARLTLTACRRMWQSAQDHRPQPWDSTTKCVTCQLGAERSGVTAAEAATKLAVESIRTICPSCQRQAPRLIHGLHCVSCYNRRREVARGRNCKGGRPRLTDALHVARLTVATGATVRIVAEGPVIGTHEAIVRLAKATGGPALFGRPPAELPHAA